MADSAQTKRLAKLHALLRRARFEDWPSDKIAGAIEDLYGKSRAAKPAAKRAAKK